jgi:dimethylamine/trimethylamine dehydrogenase
MGVVVAERLRAVGAPVTLVTPEDRVAAWSSFTAEQVRSQRRLLELGVQIVTAQGLCGFDGREATLACAYTGRERRIPADAVVMVTARQPNDGLYRALADRLAAGAEAAPKSLRRIGDCDAPAIIAAAVHAGHRYAQDLDAAPGDPDPPFRRE